MLIQKQFHWKLYLQKKTEYLDTFAFLTLLERRMDTLLKVTTWLQGYEASGPRGYRATRLRVYGATELRGYVPA